MTGQYFQVIFGKQGLLAVTYLGLHKSQLYESQSVSKILLCWPRLCLIFRSSCRLPATLWLKTLRTWCLPVTPLLTRDSLLERVSYRGPGGKKIWATRSSKLTGMSSRLIQYYSSQGWEVTVILLLYSTCFRLIMANKFSIPSKLLWRTNNRLAPPSSNDCWLCNQSVFILSFSVNQMDCDTCRGYVDYSISIFPCYK